MNDSNSSVRQHDYIIIGAGPAGLQLGYFLEKAGHDYLILEAGSGPGTFFKKFPRHRTLISSNKVYTGYDDKEINLRWDWNSLLCDDEKLLFKNYSKKYFPAAEDFTRYLSDFASHYNLKLKCDTRVLNITKDGGNFKLTDEAGNVYSCKRLVAAAGVTRPYLPPIEGIELTENYIDMSVNPDDFTNQRVLILGKGNSGFETADNLIATAASIHIASPHPLSMAWKTHFVGHLRAVNNNMLDTYQLKSQNALLDATVEKIERKDDKFHVTFAYAHAHGEVEVLVYDRVLTCTGWRFDASMFDESCRPRLTINERFPEQTAEWESTNVSDLYFAGTIMQMRDFKKTTSGFIHGFRYNVSALHNIFQQKYHGRPWPRRSFDATAAQLTEKVIERVNHSSAIWQQFGFLCDLITVSNDTGEALYFEEVPVDHINGNDWGPHDHYYTVTLEYGTHEDGHFDPFNINRVERSTTEEAHLSTFLHPIVRRFDGGAMTSEHHIIEDLAAEWMEDVHIDPLREYFLSHLRDNTVGSRAEVPDEQHASQTAEARG